MLTHRKPKVFVGSSSENERLVEALCENLKADAEMVPWWDSSVWEANQSTFGSLLKNLSSFDYGVFVHVGDDVVVKRDVEKRAVRDNVLFEMGLFYGHKGVGQTFFLASDKHGSEHIATDLLGIGSLPQYKAEEAATNPHKAVAAACEVLRAAFARFVPLPVATTEGTKQVQRKLQEIAAEVVQPDNQADQTKQPFRFQIVQDLLEDAKQEINDALSGTTYAKDISLEKSFLTRAKPIFGRASQVYATSVDLYSRFWLERPSLAWQYTDMQPSNTVRLFVYSNPRSAHDCRNVMAAHHNKYGRHGGVFFCSWLRYQKFLETVLLNDPARVQQLSESDFAFLYYHGTHGTANETYEATLNSDSLSFHTIDNNASSTLNIKSAFDNLKRLRDGEWDSTFRIQRWSNDFDGVIPTDWANALKRVFAPDDIMKRDEEEGEIYHFVFFSQNIDSPNFAGTVAEELGRLENLTDTRRVNGTGPARRIVQKVWFGTYTEAMKNLTVFDRHYKGSIVTHGPFVTNNPHCLVIKLSSTRDLVAYYENEEHSRIRRNILCACNPAVFPTLYHEWDLANRAGNEQKKKDKYDEIEAQAVEYMSRADYVRDDDVDSIVRLPAPTFGHFFI